MGCVWHKGDKLVLNSMAHGLCLALRGQISVKQYGTWSVSGIKGTN